MKNRLFKIGTILTVIITIFVIIIFLGIYTLKTVDYIENYIGSELHETFRHANKLLLDSDEFLFRYNTFLDEPDYENYEAVIESFELLYLRVGIIESTFERSSYTVSFNEECSSLYLIYSEIRSLLNLGYDEIANYTSKIIELHFEAVNLGREITQESDILAQKQIEGSKTLIIQARTRILLFISVMIFAIIIIIVLLFQQGQMTEQLRVSESKFRTIFNESFQFLGQLSTDGILKDINNTVTNTYHINRNEVIDKPFCDGPWWKNYPELQQRLELAIKKASGGETVRMDIVHKLHDGTRIYIDFSLKPVFRENGTVMMLIPEGHDITKLKKVEDELRDLRNYLANIIDSMPSMIIGVDTAGIVTQWNETSFRNTGIAFEDAVGKPLSSLIPGLSSCISLIEESIDSQEVRYEKRRKSSLGHEGCYEDLIIYPLKSSNLSGAVVRIDDVTEFVKMNEMMIQSEKMLSVGELAAGMAHEINNPLAGMMQSAEVVIERLRNENIPANLNAAADIGIKVSDIKTYMDNREILKMLSSIKDSGIRAASIVENLLSFSRKKDVAKSTHYIDILLDRAVELSSTDYDLKKTYKFKDIKIIKNYQEGLPPIPCEGQKIQQVFLNILRNGAQAMNSYRLEKIANNILNYKPEFYLTISLENEMVQVEIKDNGPGMSEEIRKRVFEPFFTTKPVGEGTGLGLSVSFYIVTDNHLGHLSVRSEEGKGARFIIQLPLK